MFFLAPKSGISNKTQENETEKIYFHETTIDNDIETKDNTLGEVLQSIGSVHDKTLDNVLEAPIHNKIKLSCEECNFETFKIKK